MDTAALAARLPVGSLGGRWSYHPRLPSTQERALAAARQGASHGELVIADQQTAGRGRGGRSWHTPAGKALAFSVVLRPRGQDGGAPMRWNAIGALAVCDALQALGLAPRIKWPNDVLLGGRKCAGVLLDAAWSGEQLAYGVLGIGLNALHGAEPDQGQVDFPATCVEEHLGRPPDRLELLLAVLEGLETWLAQGEVLPAWEARLAFRGQQVEVRQGGRPLRGWLRGLDEVGRLEIVDGHGMVHRIAQGAATLRPLRGAKG